MAQGLRSDGPLNDARLRAALGARPFHFDPIVDSTNNIAWHWALENAPAGAVVVAEEQTLGRGRFGRSWVAPAETALLTSVILRPRQQIQHVGRVTMLGAVALAETLTALSGLKPEQVSLKWPNDVQLEGRKVAGILAEAVWLGESLAAVVLGIGVNVRIDFTGTDLVERATSIETVMPGSTIDTIDRAALLARLLERIDYWAAHISEAEGESLMAAWRTRLTTVGKRVEVRSQSHDEAGKVITGQAVEADDDGALIIRDDEGTLHRVLAGDVTLAE